MSRFLAVFFLWIFVSQAHAGSGLISSYTVSGWNILEYDSLCMVNAKPMTSGSTMLFFALGSGGFSAVIGNKKWRMTKGRKGTVGVEIDGKSYGNLPTMAFSEDLIDIRLPLKIGGALQAGDYVKLQFELATYNFFLKNSRQGLAALLDCYKRRAHAAEQKAAIPSDGRSPEAQDSGVSSGSGFFVDQHGHVVTNNHVVDGCKLAEVVGFGRATIVKRDPQNDMAILKVAPSPKSFAVFRSDFVAHAQKILAFGYPLSDEKALAGSLNVTTGIISSLTGLEGDSRYVQISAPIQPGNSGGPLLDAAGHVTGMVTSKINALHVANRSGFIPENLAWALRGDLVRQFLHINGVKVEMATTTSTPKTDEVIAQEANDFTVLVKCGP